jgi:hypothetical protein
MTFSSPFKNLEFESQDFNWTADKALYAYKNVLCVIGDLSEIEHPSFIGCLSKLYKTLLQARETLSYTNSKMPALYELIPCIMKILSTSNQNIPNAIGFLCQQMCRRHDQPLNSDIFAYFYYFISEALASNDRNTQSALVKNGSNIFTFHFQGSYILVSPFLKYIQYTVSFSILTTA